MYLGFQILISELNVEFYLLVCCFPQDISLGRHRYLLFSLFLYVVSTLEKHVDQYWFMGSKDLSFNMIESIGGMK